MCIRSSVQVIGKNESSFLFYAMIHNVTNEMNHYYELMESAFERGVFPPEVHEMYRDWHRQIEAGVKQLEAVIPLTENRVPFRVRYTTEFDSAGKPVKAYGSATLVVEEK